MKRRVKGLHLRSFQRRFLASALAPGIRTAALSLPRGNGKSTLVAWLAARTLISGDPLHVSGAESHIAAASIGQARRTVFRLLREFLPATPDYQIVESANWCYVRHRPSGTKVSVIASSAKTSQGLVRTPWIFCDEPGSWEVAGGTAMYEAIQTAQGKPQSSATPSGRR